MVSVTQKRCILLGFAELLQFMSFDLRGKCPEDFIESVPGHNWFCCICCLSNVCHNLFSNLYCCSQTRMWASHILCNFHCMIMECLLVYWLLNVINLSVIFINDTNNSMWKYMIHILGKWSGLQMFVVWEP